MTPLARKGLVLAGLHLVVVSSLGAKYFIDRQTMPRVWARAAPVDPDMPVRGRYVRLRLEVVPAGALVLPAGETQKYPNGTSFTMQPAPRPVKLVPVDGQLGAAPGADDDRVWAARSPRPDRRPALVDAVAFFIPEHVADPSVRAAGEELWVEVTIPRRGLPRPIRLAVKKDGVMTPLDLKTP